MSRKHHFIRTAIPLVALILSPFISSQAIALSCPTTVKQGEELVNPPELDARRGLLETVLVVKEVAQCVPVWDANTSTWTVSQQTLRNYGWTDESVDLTSFTEQDLDKLNLKYTYPGPTLRLRKATSPEVNNGDSLHINLYNQLPPMTPKEGMVCTGGGSDAPNCYHGASITNLHFHGSHVSPQYHQDYVLLSLYPKGSQDVTPNDTDVALGDYQIRVDPFNYRQPEGSHWYHPHKHGSTALQVLNGMAGALLIEGALDDWLNNYYSHKLIEKTMLVQQINDDIGAVPGYALVNGQVMPKITMQPGEVMRFRLVGALMNNGAKYTIQFPSGFDVKQIEQDGVQFSPKNYQAQPLRTGNITSGYGFKLDPGNRVDLLVMAPSASGSYGITHKMVGQLTEAESKAVNARNKAILKAAKKDTSGDPDLFTVEVPKNLASVRLRMGGLPANKDWPALPGYLQTPTPDKPAKTIKYASNQYSGGASGPSFTIQGEAYDGSCVMTDFTTTLNSTEQWTVINENLSFADGADPTQNSPGAAHPFHIHTNPFLVTRFGDTQYSGDYDPIWMDTISLPTGGEPGTDSVSVDMLLHFEDFTGGYVNHCHFLNHEDQGMMQLVQTICPQSSDSDPKFGTPGTNAVECAASNPLLSGLKVCQ